VVAADFDGLVGDLRAAFEAHSETFKLKHVLEEVHTSLVEDTLAVLLQIMHRTQGHQHFIHP
jgi:hypothetical protein